MSSFHGQHLGLGEHNISLTWFGKPGMIWEDLLQIIVSNIEELGQPDLILIHCGGNSIGTMSLRSLQRFMKLTILKISNMLTDCKIVWSQILPRTYYRHMFSRVAAEKARKRINNSLSSFIMSKGGCYISYPELRDCVPKFYRDGTHLSELGQFFFLNTIQSALFKIFTENVQRYPSVTA